MDDIDLEKIKGDAIGDTVYSERYVLKVLIQLSQVNNLQRFKQIVFF